MSRLVQTLTELLAVLQAGGVRHAAIGGLAVVAHGVIRATQDLDFLVDASDADTLRQVMSGLGFRCIHQSADVANYLSHDIRVDFILARGPTSLALLASPSRRSVLGQEIPVVDVEGIVGLKLQALVNDPLRALDVADMRGLLETHRGAIDLDRLRVHFELVDRLDLLDDLLREAEPSSMKPHDDSKPIHFCTEGGVDTSGMLEPRDPFEAFDELMELVEALMPGPYPERPVGPHGPFKL